MAHTPFNSDITSGNNDSSWILSTEPLKYEPFSQAAETDVLVIGGGVSGLTVAYALLRAGRKVIVVEDGYIGSGETGRSTAHLTYVTDERYADLIERFGAQTAKQVLESHKAAIAWVGETVQRESTDCGFRRIDGYLFADPSDTEESLEKEFEAVQSLGCDAEMCDHIPGLKNGSGKRCIRFPGQAEIHPLKWLRGLCEAILRMGGKIYTQSKAEHITENGAEANGFRIDAKHIVIATNNTVGNRFHQQTKQWPYRSCVIAVKIPRGSIPHAFWWDTGDQHSDSVNIPYHYVRVETPENGSELLLVGGEDHRTAQDDTPPATHYDRLLEWTRAHFPGTGEVVAKWSGQIIYSIDGLAFIGRNPGSENTYIVSSDSGNGMTYSALAGMIITDAIAGIPNTWAELYDPSRSVMSKAPSDYFREAGNMVKQYGRWLSAGDERTTEQLQPGEGAVIREGLKKLAVYKDINGKLHTCPAVCPHMGGILEWNSDEKTFDCPVHGSRFTPTGKVVNGPANNDLDMNTCL